MAYIIAIIAPRMHSIFTHARHPHSGVFGRNAVLDQRVERTNTKESLGSAMHGIIDRWVAAVIAFAAFYFELK